MIATSGAGLANWAQVVIAFVALGGALLALHRWLKKNVSEPIKAVPLIRQTMASWEEKNSSVAADVGEIKVEILTVKDMAVAAAELAAEAKNTLDERQPLFGHLQEGLNKVTIDLASLKGEYVPNGGNSLRDSNDRTEVILRAVAEQAGIDPDNIVQHQTPPDKGWPQ